MTCPKCNYNQPEGQPACQKCGVVFAKLSSSPPPQRSAAPEAVIVFSDAQDGWPPSIGKLLVMGALLAAVAGVWFLVVEGPPGSPALPNSYRDSRKGFSILADPSWILLTKANYKEVIQQYGSALPPKMRPLLANAKTEVGFLKIQPGFPPSVNVVAMPLDGQMPELTPKEMEKGAKIIAADFKKILPDYQQESVRGIEVDGLQSMQLVSTGSIEFKIADAVYERLPGAYPGTTRIGALLSAGQVENYELRFVQTLVPGKKNAFVITGTATVGDSAALDAEFSRILHSFRVDERPPRFGPIVTGGLRGALLGMGAYFLFMFLTISWKLLAP